MELLVCEKSTGRVVHTRGSTVVGPVLDLAVNAAGDRGLLGIALHPDFATNQLVYLDYTPSCAADDTFDAAVLGDHRVVRFVWSGIALLFPQLVLSSPVMPGPYHNDGCNIGPLGLSDIGSC